MGMCGEGPVHDVKLIHDCQRPKFVGEELNESPYSPRDAQLAASIGSKIFSTLSLG